MKYVIFLLFFQIPVLANANQQEHWGYVDANKEKPTESSVIVFDNVLSPEPLGEPFINQEFVTELQDRYESQFGRTDAQRSLNNMEFFFQSI